MWVYFDRSRPTLEDSLRNRQTGAVVGPVTDGGRSYVLSVINVFPPLNQTFEQARGMLSQRVKRAAQAEKYRAHLEELKKKWPPEIHENVLLTAKPAAPPKDHPVAGNE